MSNKLVFFILFTIIVKSFAQENANNMPTGFDNFAIGDDLDTIKSKLKDSKYFNYVEEDVNFNEDKVPILDIDGKDIVKRAVFQFIDDKLYSLYIELDEIQMDFFTLRSSMEEKWGYPKKVTPEFVKWENDSLIVNFEKPLTIKYIDKKKLEEMKSNSNQNKEELKASKDDIIKSITG